MTTQLVKKNFGGKRKGYKGTWSALASKYPKTAGALGTGGGFLAWDAIFNLLKAAGGGKDGGRVTARGIGKAKRGFGKVLRKK